MRILCCLTSGLIYFRLCFDMLAVEMLTTAMEITWKRWKEREGCSYTHWSRLFWLEGRGHFWRWQTDGNCQVENPDSGPRLSCSLLLLRLETLNQKFDPHPAAARPPMGAGDGVTCPGGRPMGSQEPCQLFCGTTRGLGCVGRKGWKQSHSYRHLSMFELFQMRKNNKSSKKH